MADNEVAAITPKGGGALRRARRDGRGGASRFGGLHECFITLRTYDFYMRKAVLLREHRELLKPEVIWNIEKRLQDRRSMSMERAENMRVALAQRYLAFFDKYDLLLTPATVVAPYPIENRYRRRGERPQVLQLRRVARDRLCDHGLVRHRAVAALRLHAREPARSACRSPARRAARRASWRPRRRWRTCSACAARRRSIRA